MKYIAYVFGWLLVVLFTASNVFLSPLWLIVVLFGCGIGEIDWREAPRTWLGLCTAQYVFPWWDWANR